MGRIAKLTSCVLAGAWGLLIFHVDAPDAGQLHANHQPCQVCAVSRQIFQSSLPLSKTILIFHEGLRDKILDPSESDFSRPAVLLNLPRAPPQA